VTAAARPIVLAVALSGALAMPAAAIAQDGGPGVARVQGVGTAPMPPGTSIAVTAETADDTDLRLVDDITQALAARGFRVVDPAAAADGLQLWFDTEMSRATVGNDPGAATDTEVGDPLVDAETLGYGSDAAGLEDRDEVMVGPQATFSFGPGGRRAAGQPYVLSFTVGRAGEPPLWQGSVTTQIGGRQDPYAVAQAMVPILVGVIGQPVAAERAFP
jgi:hypothetical protein